jgi:hypothetical protein
VPRWSSSKACGGMDAQNNTSKGFADKFVHYYARNESLMIHGSTPPELLNVNSASHDS